MDGLMLCSGPAHSMVKTVQRNVREYVCMITLSIAGFYIFLYCNLIHSSIHMHIYDAHILFFPFDALFHSIRPYVEKCEFRC